MRQKGAIGWFKHDITHRGVTAWMLAFGFLVFYVLLYFGGRDVFGFSIPDAISDFARWIGPPVEAATYSVLSAFTDEPLKEKSFVSKWTIYGALYTVAIVGGGIYVMKKYSHNAYQLVRTAVVIFVQVSLAFSIPILLKIAGQPEYYFSYLWPLKFEYFYPANLESFPLYMVIYTLFGSLVMVPILSIIFGKRWYCSWVCGCGGLANTFGEPWRHLTSTSSASWLFEKISIHTTLVLALGTTALIGASFIVGDQYPVLKAFTGEVRTFYTFVVLISLSGIIGVVAYPIGGTRVWCRNFCPMAAMIGLVQKFGLFRITVKENMCISCGLCSKYCEMGIDVRAYAQRNQSFVRASCVGCGLCAEVCPRGVLRLENKLDRDPQELTMSTLISEDYKSPHRKAV